MGKLNDAAKDVGWGVLKELGGLAKVAGQECYKGALSLPPLSASPKQTQKKSGKPVYVLVERKR